MKKETKKQKKMKENEEQEAVTVTLSRKSNQSMLYGFYSLTLKHGEEMQVYEA